MTWADMTWTERAVLSTAARHQVDAIIAEPEDRAPVIIAGVVHDGALIHVTGRGEVPADTDDTDDTDDMADAQSRIGSISKTFTAALVLALRDDGAIESLDDPIGAYLPELPGRVGSLSLRRLLDHTAGLCREPSGAWWERNPGVPIEDLVAQISPEAAIHLPGRTYHYSNLAYGLLGAATAAASGMSWADLLRERLLAPLGMDRTTYAPVEPYLPGYVLHPSTGARREEPREDARSMAPAGQLWSTIADLARWAAFIADPEGGKIAGVLDPQTVEEACVPTVVIDHDTWSSGHSLAFQMWRAGDRVYLGHTGSMPGYLSVLMVHRPSRTGVVAFANAYSLGEQSIYRLGRDLLTAVLDGTEPARTAVPATRPPSPGGAAAELAPLLGTWWWMGIRYDAYADDDELAIVEAERPYLTPWRFTHERGDVWRCHSGDNDGEALTVLRDAEGLPEALDIATFVLLRDDWPTTVR